MSDTTALQTLHIPGIAIGAQELRTPEAIRVAEQKHVFFVPGNIIFPQVWRKMRMKMADMNIHHGFHLILNRPVGGIDYLTQQPKVHFAMFKEMYRVMSSDNGWLISDLHSRSLDAFHKAGYLHQLNQTAGIQASIHEDTLQIKKQSHAPSELPSPVW